MSDILSQNSRCCLIKLHWVTAFSLLYLALPGMLFFSSWFTPWAAWLVNLAILLSIICYARKAAQENHSWSVGIGGMLGLLGTFLLAACSFCYAGIAGFIYPAPDILIFREALYSNLISAPWPLVLPDGTEMSYYLAGMLPPALIYRLIEDYTVQRLISILWYSLGIWLSVLLFCCRQKHFSVLFVLFLTFFKDPAYIILNSVAGNGDVWNFISQFIPLPPNTYLGAMPAFYNVMNSGQTCNFSPFTVLAAALLITHAKKGGALAPLLVTLLLPISPLASIGLMPLAFVVWLLDGGFTSLHKLAALLPPVIIFVFSAVYYLRAESATCVGLHGELMGDWNYFLKSCYSTILLGAILLTITLWSVLKTDKLLCISLVCTLITPWIYFGSSPDSGSFGNNELWLKTIMIYHIHLYAALAFNWKKLNWLKYAYLGSTILLTVYNGCQEKIRWTRAPIVTDVWNGHLYHQHPSLYQKLPHCREPWIPGVLLPGGAAEKHFPGSVLPKAEGCDYSRSPMPDGDHIIKYQL